MRALTALPQDDLRKVPDAARGANAPGRSEVPLDVLQEIKRIPVRFKEYATSW